MSAIIVSDGLTAITYYFHADEPTRRLTGTELNPSIARFSGALHSVNDEPDLGVRVRVTERLES